MKHNTALLIFDLPTCALPDGKVYSTAPMETALNRHIAETNKEHGNVYYFLGSDTPRNSCRFTCASYATTCQPTGPGLLSAGKLVLPPSTIKLKQGYSSSFLQIFSVLSAIDVTGTSFITLLHAHSISELKIGGVLSGSVLENITGELSKFGFMTCILAGSIYYVDNKEQYADRMLHNATTGRHS